MTDTITLKITPHQDLCIRELCNVYNTNTSVVVRSALDYFFENIPELSDNVTRPDDISTEYDRQIKAE